jgi:hypothetical protein
MANSTKKTQRDFYNEILNGYALTDEQREFIEGRIAQLDKKATSSKGKETATQKANAELKDKILAEMTEGRGYTISEMLKEFECCAELSNQKVSAVMKQLVDAHLVVRTEDKRKAFFTKA